MLMRNTITGRFESTHLLSSTDEYGIWGNMIYRCNTPTSHLYASYGGRGIKVCDRWLSFESFISDMGERPTKKHSLDRVNVDEGYSLGNCRWATPKEQARNRRNTVYIYVAGERLQIDEYCERHGLNKATIKNRVRRGWSNDRIISTPIRSKQKC